MEGCSLDWMGVKRSMLGMGDGGRADLEEGVETVVGLEEGEVIVDVGIGVGVGASAVVVVEGEVGVGGSGSEMAF